MNQTFCLLADFDFRLGDAFAGWRAANSSALGGIILICAIGLVTVLVLVWAAFFRKRRKRRRSHHHSHHRSGEEDAASPAPVEEVEAPAVVPPPPERRRHRRSRHRHHARNPTLAETKGLPPVRPESPFQPPS